MIKVIFYILFFISSFLSPTSIAKDGGCKELVFKELNYLPQMKVSYPFRIWYAVEGRNAIANSEVMIDDLLLQLHTADSYYSKELKLTPPLEQPRYKQAEYIDVYLVDMKRGNGLAFDEIVAEKATKKIKPHSCGLKIHINSQLQPSKNITPAHELFHLYQYANSMFKARWYLEGMARWVEQAFRGVRKNELNADILEKCADVHNESYTASRYWRNLAAKKQAKDIVISEDYLGLRYADNSPVFKTAIFQNGAAVKSIFDALEVESAIQAKNNHLQRYRWPEKTQRSDQFNADICEMVAQAR